MNTHKLIEILSIQSESYNQFRMFAYIIRQCIKLNVDYYVNDGNIYITKGNSISYPCVVAHMDTVHNICEDLTVINVKGRLTGMNFKTMQQTGIGGDDKVGIYIALECLKKFNAIKIVFFRDEEVGCEGSYNADIDFFDDCNFILQCDRKGSNDFITRASGTKLSSEKFQKTLKPLFKRYGYKICEYGMMTDIMALKECNVKCSVANISCGYYNAHTAHEYVNINVVFNCLLFVMAIIESYGHIYFEYKYEAPKYKSAFYGNDNRSDSYYDSKVWKNYYDNLDAKRNISYSSLPKKQYDIFEYCESCLNHTKELKFSRDVNEYLCEDCYKSLNAM